ncbi:enoyl-CoA delta isomerase 2, peroxisomal-like [Aristolochia californica]|uniref:enoyl-CoA delta isomerase 2, peroxisomal-like n=1 Tax=Aristolochia californica TaxID=171875 RepID=UPI0035D7FF3D
MCTLEKHGQVFVLTLTGEDEHRLGPTLIGSILAHLQRLRADATPGSVLVTAAEGKFYSNGFDLKWAQEGGAAFTDRLHHMVSSFERQIMAEFLSLPMPTISVVTGHAAAAGFILALCHDYVFMRNDSGVLYMSELDIGIPYPDSFIAMMRTKIANPAARRDIVLRSAKVKATEAVKMGIIDAAHDSAGETLAAAMRLAEELAKKKWGGDIYAGIRKGSLLEVSEVLGVADKGEKPVRAPRL